MPIELVQVITIIAGVIITWLLFSWFLKVIQTSIKTALTIGLILFCLQIFLGIKYQQVWQELSKLVPELLTRLIRIMLYLQASN